MLVVVGSENEPKRQSVQSAFSLAYDSEVITVEVVKADSGVSSHPTSGSESLTGAINRAQHARELRPGANYYVGIEGGLLEVDDRVWELGWVAVASETGEIHTAPSSGVELEGRFLNAIKDGKEINEIVENSLGIKSIGDYSGFYGLTTDGQVTREQAYAQAIIFALAPFKHPEYFK